mgnify:CR=1 FL=1
MFFSWVRWDGGGVILGECCRRRRCRRRVPKMFNKYKIVGFIKVRSWDFEDLGVQALWEYVCGSSGIGPRAPWGIPEKIEHSD